MRWLLFLLSAAAFGASSRYDLVVYGATAAGVITAVSGAREGLHVLLLEPGKHVGGMAASGLSRTDFGQKSVIGGYALEFFQRVGKRYQMERFGQDSAWYYEPHVGEAVFMDMLSEAKVDVHFAEPLQENEGVLLKSSRILKIVTNRQEYLADLFADCSYEGDLMAQAHVTYTWGREATTQYNEPLAGVRKRTPFHQFPSSLAAYDSDGALLPEISAQPKGATGQGDKKVQAYNFRLILTNDAANLLPFERPELYDPRRYQLLAKLLAQLQIVKRRPPKMDDVLSVLVIPNHKVDVNNNGPFSTDYIGGSWDYPQASYARRGQIWQAHKNYTEGLLYYLANDPIVPEALRTEMKLWGLAKDEFLDSGHWPPQLYIREARRMVGDFVMTQQDIQSSLTKPDAIGIGSYNSDSHNVQRFINDHARVENEGDMQVPVKPYQIPYRVMTPGKIEVTNLLVPVCFSASHVAYSSLRMEPQYMILGQAAGVAASLAIKNKVSVQDVPINLLQQKLRVQKAVF